MNEIATQIINATKDNSFLQTIYDLSLGDQNNIKTTVTEIVNLHNDKLINAISEFRSLSKEQYPSKFFPILHIIEHALPNLKAPIEPVMDCIKHLTKEAGADLSANMLFKPFINFCHLDPSHPKNAIELAVSLPDQWRDFLSSSIVAGTNFDIEHYVNQAIRLTSHENIEIRKMAIFSLGEIKYLNNVAMLNQSFENLQGSVNKETDDHLLAILIKSAFKIYLSDNSLENKITIIIQQALAKGRDYTVYAASELFGFNIAQLPNELLDTIIHHLTNIPLSKKNILDQIDFGIVELLRQGHIQKAINFLENLLVSHHSDNLQIEAFDRFICECHTNKIILNKIATRWLLRGDPKLCIALKNIINFNHTEDVYLEVCMEELISCEEHHYIFIARKAIGYFFSKPLSATSIILSLIGYTSKNAPKAFIELLVDPLLINYPNKVGKYLNEILKIKTGTTKRFIQNALKKSKIYFEELNATGEIIELLPSEAQREADYRHRSRIMHELSKKAKNHSPFISRVSKIHLLYGKKIINYTYDLNQQPKRVEISLQNFRITAELPRLEYLDSIGIEYMLRTFRAERLIS